MTNLNSGQQLSHQPRTLAITGGKGGVGKTSIALNLALSLSREGNRVLLLDGDTDLANVSIMLGRYPERTLANVVAGECDLQDVIMQVQHGLHIIPGASGVERCIDMDASDSLPVLRALARLEKRYDYVLTDTAAGLQPAGLHMIAAADMACVVITPDPASLTDAFSLVKVLHRRGYQRTPSVVVNMAQGASQAQSVFQRFAAAAQRHLGIKLHYLGGVWRDETLRQSVLSQTPVALLAPSDPSCRQFFTLADMLKVRLAQLPPRKAGIAAYWHHLSRKSVSAENKPRAQEAPPSQDPLQACQHLITELEHLLTANASSSMLRYEAFNGVFALLGRTMDEDTIEIAQTGLAALEWERLSSPQRAHFARHLRQLADQVSPSPAPADSTGAWGTGAPISQPVTSGSGPAPDTSRPLYDRGVFGEQHKLAQALREHPVDVSLDQLLRALAGTGRGGS